MELLSVVSKHVREIKTDVKPITVGAAKIDNAVLKRLISEIDFERQNHVNAYNRTHDRHNRGR